MDLSGQGNRRLSSLISRFQKNAPPPEETKFSPKQEARTESRPRNAVTSQSDDHLNTSGPLKGVSTSTAGFMPVSQSSRDAELSREETRNDLDCDWVTKATGPALEVKTAVAKETSPASQAKTTIQPATSEAGRETDEVVEDIHNFLERRSSYLAEHSSDSEAEVENDARDEADGVDFARGNSGGDYNDIADFNVDELLEESSDDELPTLQEIYQRCQTIQKRRFYEDLYNVWQEKIRSDEKEDAMKILSACGFGKGEPDEMGDGLDTALSLVPDRFWHHDSHAKEISIEDLKMIVEEKKDAEELAQYRKYSKAADGGGAKTGQTRSRRAAIATGGGQSSTILHNYLKMNLLKNHVPMYYFPSYLRRFKAATE